MSFFEELKRRNVIRVAIAYGVAAWFVLQLADVVLENIGAPEWVMQTIMLVLVVGLYLATGCIGTRLLVSRCMVSR